MRFESPFLLSLVFSLQLPACIASRQPTREVSALPPSSIIIPQNPWSPQQQAVHVSICLAYGPSPSEETNLFEGRDLAASTDFRAVLAEILTSHLGVTKVAQIFPGFEPSAAGRVGLFRT